MCTNSNNRIRMGCCSTCFKLKFEAIARLCTYADDNRGCSTSLCTVQPGESAIRKEARSRCGKRVDCVSKTLTMKKKAVRKTKLEKLAKLHLPEYCIDTRLVSKPKWDVWRSKRVQIMLHKLLLGMSKSCRQTEIGKSNHYVHIELETAMGETE